MGKCFKQHVTHGVNEGFKVRNNYTNAKGEEKETVYKLDFQADPMVQENEKSGTKRSIKLRTLEILEIGLPTAAAISISCSTGSNEALAAEEASEAGATYAETTLQ